MTSLPTSSSAPAAMLPALPVAAHSGGCALALWELTKPRLALFSVFSAMTGYLVAGEGRAAAGPLGVAFLGITLAAGGALAFNQCLEWRLDARMRRTCGRPLPSGRISPTLAMGWTALLCLGGTALLSLAINLLAGALAAATIFIYGCLYTPLKRRTPWATEVGAVSGALPPLLGAAAAGMIQSPAAWVFAAYVLFWQMPHFYAIGWIHRQDYAAAGFRLRPVIDPTGGNTAAWTLVYASALLVVSLVPPLCGWISGLYALAAVPPALAGLALAAAFLLKRDGRDCSARRLFALTLLQLPVVMLALACAGLTG